MAKLARNERKEGMSRAIFFWSAGSADAIEMDRGVVNRDDEIEQAVADVVCLTVDVGSDVLIGVAALRDGGGMPSAFAPNTVCMTGT